MNNSNNENNNITPTLDNNNISNNNFGVNNNTQNISQSEIYQQNQNMVTQQPQSSFSESINNFNQEPIPVNVETPVQAPINNFNQEPVIGNVEVPVQAPVNNFNPEPVPVNVETPVQAPVNNFNQEPVPVNVEVPEQAPVNNFNPEPVPVNVEVPVQAPVNNFNPEPIPVNVEVPVQAPVNNFNQEPVPVNVETPVQAPVNNFNPEPIPVNVETPVQTPVNNFNSEVPNNNIQSQQMLINDDDLLKAFIGNNYEKITTRKFNFAGFFGNTLYMCYRKMFGYAVLAFLASLILFLVVNKFLVFIGMNIVIGVFVNNIYLKNAKKKIAILKANNSQKSNEELKLLCAAKGGTSVGQIFLGLFAQFGMALVALLIVSLMGLASIFGTFIDFGDLNIKDNETSENNDTMQKNGRWVENIRLDGYGCINSKCSVGILLDSTDNSEQYVLNIQDKDFFNNLGNYEEYIRIDICYNKRGKDKVIYDYKLYLKSTEEDISSVKNESELREKIGLYSIGIHTDSFTLKEKGSDGFGFSGDVSYTYSTYVFVDNKNIEYEMNYIHDGQLLELTVGNTYNVTFEVTEGSFDYDFTIKSVN